MTDKTYDRALSPVDDEGRYYHVRARAGEVAPFVLLPGDPGRVPRISQFWDSAREIANHRTYTLHTGTLDGIPISAVSTGVGNPSTATVIEQLARLEARTLIRVGSTGAIQPGIALGEVIISTGAMRLDGATRQYVPPEYPAVAHYEVVLALVEASQRLGIRYHLGITASTDSWYLGQGRPGFRDYLPSWRRNFVDDLRQAGVVNFEMESSAVLTLGQLYGLRAGVVCAVFANRVDDTFAMAGEENAIRVANEAVKILTRMDAEKERAGAVAWHPGLVQH